MMTPSTAPDSFLRTVPIRDEGLGNQSYLVGLRDGRALVVDSSRDPSPYLRTAQEQDLRIAFAVETHLHADFISGSRELAAQGATILAPRAAELRTDYRGLDDGDEVDLGDLTLRAIGTPGHTPEHLAYLLLERGVPLGLFSGGAIIPGGAARTDLIDPRQTEELARALHRSVRQHLEGLPDDLALYPTHGSGSFCSTGTSGRHVSTVGWERRVNPLLTISDEDAFVRHFLAGLGSYPSYFRRLRAVNQLGARLYGPDLPPLEHLSVDQVQRSLAAGASLIDTRPYREFATGHIPGALAIALRPAFASWLGWLFPADRPLMFVLGAEQDRRDLIAQCLKVGYENLLGELEGGMAAWRAAGLPERTVVLRQVNEEIGGTLLDVRQDNEWAGGHLPGARHLELGRVPDAAGSFPANHLTIYCSHGDRAMSAASFLEARGHQQPAVIDGGFEAWSRAGRPVAVG